MAKVDFSNAKQGVFMSHETIADFDLVGNPLTPAQWSWHTSGGHSVHVKGSGFSYDAQGRAVAGRATEIGIDLDDDDAATPDILITGIDVAAPGLDDGRDSFWGFLAGDDEITGGTTANAGLDAQFVLYGDAFLGKAGSRGGNDMINSGDTKGFVYGDALVVASPVTGGAPAFYQGGNDTLFGPVSLKGGMPTQQLAGDVAHVEGAGRLAGGDDTIFARASDASAYALGDADNVYDRAVVIGGNDTIKALGPALAIMVGDVNRATGDTFVRGGRDTITGNAQANLIVGDVYSAQGQVQGGADMLSGGGGNDTIVGDIYQSDGARIVYGADIIHGGDGDDFILGDSFTGTAQSIAQGNDHLHGDAGDDTLFGQSGNDLLDGGVGGDRLDGGIGFDMASYASAAAGVRAALDGSFAFTNDALGDAFNGVEALEGSGFADILGGDANANRILGGEGNDALHGRAGGDILVGGLGADNLTGGAGNDAFDYTAVNQGFDRITDFSNVAGNNDILRFEGDVYGGLPNGLLAANRFVANATGLATTLDQRFVYETDTGVLRFDANGSAAGGMVNIVVFTGAPALTAADFLII